MEFLLATEKCLKFKYRNPGTSVEILIPIIKKEVCLNWKQWRFENCCYFADFQEVFNSVEIFVSLIQQDVQLTRAGYEALEK